MKKKLTSKNIIESLNVYKPPVGDTTFIMWGARFKKESNCFYVQLEDDEWLPVEFILDNEGLPIKFREKK